MKSRTTNLLWDAILLSLLAKSTVNSFVNVFDFPLPVLPKIPKCELKSFCQGRAIGRSSFKSLPII